MKNLISREEIEFIVLQLIDQGKLDEADDILKQNSMSRSEWLEPEKMRYNKWHLEDLD